MNVIEEKRTVSFKRPARTNMLQVVKAPKPLYIVGPDNDRPQKKEQANRIKQDADKKQAQEQIGLPQQPTGYIKYSDHDCL